MKTKLLISVILIFGIAEISFSQFVTIPDTNFRKILKLKYPECFNSINLLDTSCTSVITETFQILSKKEIHDLEGIQYFDSLKYLSCDGNQLKKLPSMPKNLLSLSCDENQLNSLPLLPSALLNLNCSKNQLTTLPTLPESLNTLNCNNNLLTTIPRFSNNITDLYCSYNLLISLPSLPFKLQSLTCDNNNLSLLPELPSGLKRLWCEKNKLILLPTLPDSLQSLWCSFNNLTNLPFLPKNLTEISLYYNQLTTLPTLPDSLKSLACFGNNLKSLPSLPDKLEQLGCQYNQITILPKLPVSLKNLECTDNQLTNLPELPKNLEHLGCGMNKDLFCLPFLPPFLNYLSIDQDRISCLPNKPQGIIQAYNSYPICNITNNTSQCKTYPYLKGKVFIDDNNDNTFNEGETPIQKISIRELSTSNSYTITSSSGDYLLAVDTLGKFIFKVDSTKYFNTIPAKTTVTFNRYGEEYVQDFALQANVLIENMETKLTPMNIARPGFPLSFTVENSNIGTISTLSSASFNYPSEFIIDSISSGGSISSNGTISWPSVLIRPFKQQINHVYGHISNLATLGSNIYFNSSINPNSKSDVDKSNNQENISLLIRGSFDPNDKQATPVVTPLQVASGGFVEYTIRFQNEGTDTAFTIVVIDSLSSKLQAGTLEMISSSHNCMTTINGSVVSFKFSKINLLWSAFDEIASHGYIRFKIKPKTNLTIGDVIENKASIYFDYNTAIVTNTAATTVGTIVVNSINESTKTNSKLTIYPNPANTHINLSENGMIEVCSITGIIVLKEDIKNQILDISNLTKGIYYLKLKNYSGIIKSLILIKE